MIYPLTDLKGNQIGASFWCVNQEFVVEANERQGQSLFTDSNLGKPSPANTGLTDLVCKQPRGSI